MLPDFRFVIGAVAVTALLGMTGLGLFASTRLSQQAQVGPLETARNLTFADHVEWNQFYDADSVRRFVGLGRKAEAAVVAEVAAEIQTEDPANAGLATAIVPLAAPEVGSGDETLPVLAATSAGEEKGETISILSPAASVPALAPPAPPQALDEHPAVETATLTTDNVEPALNLATDIETTDVKAVAVELGPSIAPGLPKSMTASDQQPVDGAATTAEIAALAQGPDEGADNSAVEARDLTSKEPQRDAEKATAPDREPQAAPRDRPAIQVQSPNGSVTSSAQVPAQPAAPRPSAVPGKVSAPIARLRRASLPAKRAAEPETDSGPKPLRSSATRRVRDAAPRQRYATQPSGPQPNGAQWVDPRQVAGPHYGPPPYNPPQYNAPPQAAQPSGAPQFGLHPYVAPQLGANLYSATQPQARQSRAPRYRVQQPQYGPQPVDPRQFAPPPQPYAQGRRAARPSFNDPLGWR